MDNSFKEAKETGANNLHSTEKAWKLAHELWRQAQKLWLELLQAEKRYMEKVQDAEEKLNGVDGWINELKARAGINEVPFSVLIKLKGQLKSQVEKITDPATEVKAYVQAAEKAREELQNTERTYWNQLPFSITRGTVEGILFVLFGLFLMFTSFLMGLMGLFSVAFGTFILFSFISFALKK